MPLTKRKAGTVLVSGSVRARLVDEHAPALAQRIAHFLEVKKHHVSLAARAAYEKVRKDDSDDVERILADLGLNSWDELATEVRAALIVIYKEGGAAAIAALGENAPPDLFDVVNPGAQKYAAERGAELVGKKWVNGELVENPDAQWAITDTTRSGLQDLIERALKDGLSPTELGDEIEDSFLFSPSRADLIARTELSFAHTNGSNEAMAASGVVTGKQLILSSGHDQDDECDDYADVVVDLDDGDADPPIHPSCECSLEYVLAEDVQ